MSDTNSRQGLSDADLRVRARRDDAIAEPPRNDTARVQAKLNEAGEFLRYAAHHDGRRQDLGWIKDQAREQIQDAREINRSSNGEAAMKATSQDKREVRQERAAEHWAQRIQTGQQSQQQTGQQQKQEVREVEKPRQPRQ